MNLKGRFPAPAPGVTGSETGSDVPRAAARTETRPAAATPDRPAEPAASLAQTDSSTDSGDYRALLRQIRRLARALDVQSRRIDREVGLTLPQLLVLTSIGELGEVTGRALSAEADLSPPTVVGVLDKLEAKGLIQRYRSDRDRRVVHARLTPAGRAALAAAPDPLGAPLSGGFRALPPAQRAAVLDALTLLGRLAGTPDGTPDPGTPAPPR